MIDNKDEIFPEVDADGRVVGSVRRGEAHGGSMKLHPVVHLHVFDSSGRLFLQKRPAWKDIQPNKWDTACGGHVMMGESIDEALRREVEEELGMTQFLPKQLGHYVFESQRERELVYVHTTIYDGIITPSSDELDGGRFWTREEIADAIGKNILTPNFEQEYKRFLCTHN